MVCSAFNSNSWLWSFLHSASLSCKQEGGPRWPQSLVRVCLSSAVQHAKRTFGVLGGFPGPRESGPDGPEVGSAVFYARRACTDRRTWWHSCVCTHVHALIATFRVARLSLQTRNPWCRDRPKRWRHVAPPPPLPLLTKIRKRKKKRKDKKERKTGKTFKKKTN